jgi:hypothetical protein
VTAVVAVKLPLVGFGSVVDDDTFAVLEIWVTPGGFASL